MSNLLLETVPISASIPGRTEGVCPLSPPFRLKVFKRHCPTPPSTFFPVKAALCLTGLFHDAKSIDSIPHIRYSIA